MIYKLMLFVFVASLTSCASTDGGPSKFGEAWSGFFGGVGNGMAATNNRTNCVSVYDQGLNGYRTTCQ